LIAKFKVCLTGGIASGKTYVSNKLSTLGAHVIDADLLARKVVEINSPGLDRIVEAFGKSILDDNKSLNRLKLKEVVFNDKAKLSLLNSIMHPLIREAFSAASKLNQEQLEVWVIPLYERSSDRSNFNRIILVDVREDIQLKRITQRDGVSIELAKSIIDFQPGRESRLEFASDVITNNKSFEILDVAINQVFEMFQKMKNKHAS
jgi:dephospho-CoA kinase